MLLVMFFAEAGFLTITGNVEGSYAAYDDATELLYTMMLDRLAVFKY